MAWDPLVEGVFASWPQMKVHKFKVVGVLAGSDRHICSFNALACAFASGCFKQQVWQSDEMNYFFPKLGASSSVTTTITNYLKALASGSSNTTYVAEQG